MAAKRKYDDNYIKFGFTAIESNGETKPQCVICSTVLSNDALKPAKLKRHLQAVHPNLCDKTPEFFKGKLENLKKMKLGPSGTRFVLSEKKLAVSFEIAKLIAKSKKPHTIAETLVKPCIMKAVEEIFGMEAKEKIKEIPLSNNTIKSRIQIMSNDIEEQIILRIKKSPFFSLQCDESTDVSNCCQLLVFVRFLNDENKKIEEELLISTELETTTKGADVMNLINEYFMKHNILWEKLAGFCTDGAPAMLGSRSGLATLIKQKNPSAITTHCFIHRQALASKTLPVSLNSTLVLAIKVINVIKNSALNTRLFKKLCTEMDSDFETLLFHTEVRWLSKGNMLERLYHLRQEVELFLAEKKIKDLHEQFSSLASQMQLAYLVDIFAHLNKLNLQLQGSGNLSLEHGASIFIFEDKLRAFICKLKLWITQADENNFFSLPTLNILIHDQKYKNFYTDIKENITCHLKMLVDEFNCYFPECSQSETQIMKKMIRNPFSIKVKDVVAELQEELIELQNDSNFRDVFESCSLEEFWCKKATSYVEIRQIAMRYLTLFSTTYLCEQGFSALLIIKNKYRNRLNVSHDMRVGLTNNIEPRIMKLVKTIQAQKSH